MTRNVANRTFTKTEVNGARFYYLPEGAIFERWPARNIDTDTGFFVPKKTTKNAAGDEYMNPVLSTQGEVPLRNVIRRRTRKEDLSQPKEKTDPLVSSRGPWRDLTPSTRD